MTTTATKVQSASSTAVKQKGSGVFVRPVEHRSKRTTERGVRGGAESFFADAKPIFTAVRRSGAVLSKVKIQLIFWGSDWRKEKPPVADVEGKVRTLLASSYMDALKKNYSDIESGTLSPSITFDKISLADPPRHFRKDNIENLIKSLINGAALASSNDSQMLYCVLMPRHTSSIEGDFFGEHSFVEVGGKRVHYAWLLNDDDGKLDFITKVFSHELIESVSDPDGDGVVIVPDICHEGSWCEISDVCAGIDGVVGDIVVQSYWSQKDKMCVIPGGVIAPKDL